jgi:dihydrofolate reductase
MKNNSEIRLPLKPAPGNLELVVTIISAIGQNGVIGFRGQLPWKIPMDMKQFRARTFGKPVLMGRKTFESIGSKPLPGRSNIVVTKSDSFALQHENIGGLTVLNDLTTAVYYAIAEASKLKEPSYREVMVLGGESVYRDTMKFATKMVLTYVDVVTPGDTKFPDFGDEWTVYSEEKFFDPEGFLIDQPENKGLSFTVKTYMKTPAIIDSVPEEQAGSSENQEETQV